MSMKERKAGTALRVLALALLTAGNNAERSRMLREYASLYGSVRLDWRDRLRELMEETRKAMAAEEQDYAETWFYEDLAKIS